MKQHCVLSDKVIFYKRIFLVVVIIWVVGVARLCATAELDYGDESKIVESNNYVPPNPEVYTDEDEWNVQGENPVINPYVRSDNTREYVQEANKYLVEGIPEENELLDSGQMLNVLIIPIQFPGDEFLRSQESLSELADRLQIYYELNSGYVPEKAGITLKCNFSETILVQNSMSYYGEDGTSHDNANGHIGELAREAVLGLDALGYDFDPYDGDGDGYADYVVIMHAGYGQEEVKDSNLIWSHQSGINGEQPVDNVNVYKYMMIPEDTKLGTLAHEFGHALGLQDLYDTNGSAQGDSNGIGDWGLMGTGVWNRLAGDEYGSSPANLCAWSKVYLGWEEPETLLMNQHKLELDYSIENDTIYKVYPEGNLNSKEYYLIEFRPRINFDEGLPGQGVLIWHVNESVIEDGFDDNELNTDSDNLGVQLEQADGRYDLVNNPTNRGDESDPFGGTSTFNDFSALPFKMNYTSKGEYTFVDILDVEVSGMFSSFDVYIQSNIKLDAPNEMSPNNGESVSVNPLFKWERIPLAEGYVLELSEDIDFEESITEVILDRDVVGFSIDNDVLSYQLPSEYALDESVNYYWRVAGYNDKSDENLSFSENRLMYTDKDVVYAEWDFVYDDAVVNIGNDGLYLSSALNKSIFLISYSDNSSLQIPTEAEPGNMFLHKSQLFICMNGESDTSQSVAVMDASRLNVEEFIYVNGQPLDVLVTEENELVVSVETVNGPVIQKYSMPSFDLIDESIIDEAGDLIYIPGSEMIIVNDSKYGDIELTVGPSGDYVFGSDGKVYLMDSVDSGELMFYKDLEYPYHSIFFGEDNEQLMTIDNNFIREYDPITMELTNVILLSNSISEVFQLDEQKVSVVDVQNVFRLLPLKISSENEMVTFSFDGESASKIIGSNRSMTYSTDGGLTYNVITGNNMLLSHDEILELYESAVLYVELFPEESVNNHPIGIEFTKNNLLDDSQYVIWDDKENILFSGNSPLEFRDAETASQWFEYNGEAFDDTTELIQFRRAAQGHRLPGDSFVVPFNSGIIYDSYGWFKSANEIFVDNKSNELYLVDIEKDLFHVNTDDFKFNYLTTIETEDDIFIYNNQVYRLVRDIEKEETVLEGYTEDNGFDKLLQRFDFIVSDYYISSTGIAYLLIEDELVNNMLVKYYDLNSEKLSDEIVSIYIDNIEDISYIDNMVFITSYGDVYLWNSETDLYEKTAELDLVVDKCFFDLEAEILVLFSEQTIRVFSTNGYNMIDTFEISGNLLAIYGNQEYIEFVIKDNEDVYRVGDLKFIPKNHPIEFSFDGANSYQLVGSTVEMEYSLNQGDSYLPIVEANMSIEAFKDLITAENGILVRNIKTDGYILNEAELIDIVVSDETLNLQADDEDDLIEGLEGNMEWSLNNGINWIKYNGEEPELSGNQVLWVRYSRTRQRLESVYSIFNYSEKIVEENTSSSPGSSNSSSSSKPSTPTIIPTELVEVESIIEEKVPQSIIERASVEISEENLSESYGFAEGDRFIPVFSRLTITERRDLVSDNKYATIADHYYSLAATIIEDEKTTIVTGFDLPASIMILVNEEADDVDWRKAGAYKYDELEQNWTYVGGIYDVSDNTFTFECYETAIYALFEFDKRFVDIQGHWAQDSIEILASKHITNGKSEEVFDPDSNITRAEYIAMVIRGLKIKEEFTRIVFQDVDEEEWYYDTVNRAYGSGIIGDELAVRPDVDISREDMMVYAVNALRKAGNYKELSDSEINEILSVFKDSDKVKAENREVVAIAVSTGIINGRSEDILAVLSTATRAETVVVITRLLSFIN